jgi:CBS domain-containing protein
MKIEELMTRSPVTVTPSCTLVQAARRMLESEVGSVVVADAGRVLGVLTDRDVALAVACPREFDPQTRVDRVMTPRPVMIRSGAPLSEGLELMRAHTIRRLVVVDGDERLVGVVSLDDVLIQVGNAMAAVADLVREEVAWNAA